ncbi:hypothetical protein KI387_034784, partial [Taxus chinensis]
STPLPGKPDFWPGAARKSPIHTLCPEKVAIGGLDHWEKSEFMHGKATAGLGAFLENKGFEAASWENIQAA